ncbi:MAG: EAL domain-containing protein [Rhodobacteraceae bacterium]|nr:EAL domain-containing protein [Paracoccaceae bacterium]
MARPKTRAFYYLGVLVVLGITQILAMRFDTFEQIEEFARAHEGWEVDEVITFFLLSVFALLAVLLLRTNDLHKALGERDRAEREAHQMSRHDPLTGLPNRRALQDHFDMLAAAGTGGAAVTLLIDLDRFKHVNDLHGHEFGDRMLQLATERIVEDLGPQDFAARLGGDEFAVVLRPGTPQEAAERIARRLLTRLERPYEAFDIVVLMGASIGLSVCELDELHDSALRLADRALYAAKRAGRGRLAWYDDELGARATERAALEADLRLAVARHEIVPFFQPIVEIGDGRIAGYEVLARWEHPERGPVPPSVFIEIAEDIGIISTLGSNILREACNTALDWDPGLRISVNVSPQQFRDSMLVTNIRQILAETGFDPARLELEVTESAIIADFDLARQAIRELQELGISVALDDFGTGFSSLSSLRQLPFDRIKIDRSFVTGIVHNSSNQKILAGIMTLANGLDIPVTAEGVETAEDRDFLASIACTTGQGFWFDRPRPADQVNWMLETHQAPGEKAAALARPAAQLRPVSEA